MSNKTRLVIKSTFRFDQFKSKSKEAMDNAIEKASIQMLDWMASGSANSSLIPPRLTGVLASSGSVFYNGKLIALSPNIATDGQPTPNKSYSGKGVTWGFNTEYATKMHEATGYSPGHISARLPGSYPGNRWVSEHLKKDKKDYYKLINKYLLDSL